MTDKPVLTRREVTTLATGAAAAAALGVTSAEAAPQPHMEAARAALQLAKHELQIAVPNKGGHRIKAINYVNAAIAEVNLGIAFAN